MADNNQQALKAELVRIKEPLQTMIPRNSVVDADRIIKVMLSATNRNPALLKTTVRSLVRCAMQGAELGLEIGGILGHAYIVPYKDEATMIVGYKGLMELARRSGKIKSVSAYAVFERDNIRIDLANMSIAHEPCYREDHGALIGCYAQAFDLDGNRMALEWMQKADIDKIRARSRAGQSGPWVTDYNEMGKKTVVRRMSKYLPLATAREEELLGELEAQEAGAIDTVGEDVPGELGDAPAPALKPASKGDEIAARLRKGRQAAQVQVPVQVQASPAEHTVDLDPSEQPDSPPPDDYVSHE